MLLARTPMKPAGDVCEDVPKPVKWLRCLQCNQKFPEDRFREHQRESKSPCELVRPRPSHRRRANARDPGGIASARVGRARVVSSVCTHDSSRVTRFRLHRAARRARPAPTPPRPFARPRQDLPRLGGPKRHLARRAIARARVTHRALFPANRRARGGGDVAPARRVAPPLESAPLTTPSPPRPSSPSPGFSRPPIAGEVRRVPGAVASRAEGRAREGVPRPRREPEGGCGRRCRRRRARRHQAGEARGARRTRRAAEDAG